VPKSIPALVNKDLLIWARKTAGYRNIEATAKKVGVSVATLQSWETGTTRPTIAQARKLAEVYRRPLALFFLPQIPKGYSLLKEYRRLAGAKIDFESPALCFALQTAEFRREVFLENLDEREKPIAFEGRAHLTENPETVGARLREYLDVEMVKQCAWGTPHEALAGWRGFAELHGVLVFQPSKVSLLEMRGAIIPHPTVPVILLNPKDAPYGRVFTLLHELTHLWLVRGGHDSSTSERLKSVENRVTEVFCNAAAAAVLLPKEVFLRDPDVAVAAQRSPHDLSMMRVVGKRYGVSAETVCRRLSTLGLISAEEYDSLRKSGRFGGNAKRTNGPVAIEVRVLSEVGLPFAEAVISAYYREQLTGNRLSDYLGAKLKYLPKIEGRIAQRQTARREAAVG